MKFGKVRNSLYAVILVILVSMCGCGNDDRRIHGPSVSVIKSGAGKYIIQGERMDGVAAIELNLLYDKSRMIAPTVTKGEYISGALLAANTLIPGAIKIAIVDVKPLAGDGELATVSFYTEAETAAGVSIESVKMHDAFGNAVQ